MSRHRQHGAVLLALTLLLAATLALQLLAFAPAAGDDRRRHTARVLHQARQALVAWALLYPELHDDMPVGYLPCPDQDGDGIAEPVCEEQGRHVLGRLPWRTLKLPPLRDGDGQCLWYAVSGNYKNSPKLPLSSDSDGALQWQRLRQIDVAIAMLFAPGAPLPGQRRGDSVDGHSACGGRDAASPRNRADNYLERLPTSSIGDGELWWFRDSTTPVNDSLLALLPDHYRDVYRRMDHWVAARVQACLVRYLQRNVGHLPFASAPDAGDYFDEDGRLYGRIANAIGDGDETRLQGLANTVAADDGMRQAWENSPGAAPCFYEAGNTASDWWWWPAWKSMVFVRLDAAIAPGATGTASRLRLDRRPQQALVLVAGRRLSGQDRRRGELRDYLEGNNAALAGNDFVTRVDGGNDVIVGIRGPAP